MQQKLKHKTNKIRLHPQKINEINKIKHKTKPLTKKYESIQ